MITYEILSVLQLINWMKPVNWPNSSVSDYRREGLSFYSSEYDNRAPFGGNGYPICPPASNTDCYYFRDFHTKIVRRCPKGMLWVGIGDEVKPMLPKGMMADDKIMFRGHKSSIPEAWLRKDCSLTGEYGMPVCSGGDYIREKMTQVVLLNGMWHAVRTVLILVSDEPYLRTCWQKSSVVPKCDDTIAVPCNCIEYSLGTLFVQRKGHKIAVDGVGLRTIKTAQHVPDPGTGICDLVSKDGEWFVETDRAINQFRMITRKGPHEMICEPDEVSHICYDKGWSSFSGVIKVSLYRDGLLYAVCSADDEVNDFCQEVSYFYRWKHYQCWGMLEHGLMVVACLVIVCLFALLTLISCIVCTHCYPCIWWCCLPIRFIGKGLTRRRAKKEDLVKILEEGDNRPLSNTSGRSSQTSVKLKKAALGLLLASQAKNARAECTSLEMLSFASACMSDQCVLSGKSIAWIPSRNGVACFDVRTTTDKVLDLSYEFHIESVFRKCVPFDDYWTHDYHPRSCAQFYCPSTCWDIKPENKWEYLEACSVTPLSHIIKQTHQGCAGVGCIRCDDACVLYTKFFVADTYSRPVKVFKCSDWTPQMKGKMIKRSGLNSTSKDFLISTLTPITLLGVKIQWNYETSAFSFFQTESFIQDADRLCMTHASRRGSPVKGQIGYVQCQTENQTHIPKQCLKMEEDIECTVGSKAEVTCVYQSPRWEKSCSRAWLPVERSGYSMIIEDRMPAISAHDFGLSQIVLELEGGEVANFIEPKSSCKILDGTVSGCFSCDEGALLEIVSHPTNGAPTVRVSCEKSIANFKFICGEGQVKVRSSTSVVDTKCTASWGGKIASFKIKGVLVEQVDIETQQVNGSYNRVIDRSWQMPSASAFKLHFLLGTLMSTFIIFFGLMLWCRCH